MRSAEDHTFTEAQLMAIRAIMLIEQNFAPACEECGYSADNMRCPNDLGGFCRAYDQENTITYNETIDELKRAAGLKQFRDWKLRFPLDKVFDLSDEEKALMLDLLDQPEHKLVSRREDERYDSLRKKEICFLGYVNGRCTIDFTKRGLEWARKLAAETEAA